MLLIHIWTLVCIQFITVSVLFTALGLCILQPCVCACAVYNIGPVYITTLGLCILQPCVCAVYSIGYVYITTTLGLCILQVYITTLCLCLCLPRLDVESLLEVETAKDALWFKPFIYLHSAVNHPDGNQLILTSVVT